jgi:hypothetical protein
MPDIKAPLTDAELALFEIVSIPSVFGEFVRSSPRAPKEKQWRYWPQQIREMNREEPHKRRFQGRNLGKTITCMDEMNSMVLMYNGEENGVALIGTRADPNLHPIFSAQAALWGNNRFLKHFLIKDTKRAIDRKNKEIRLFSDNRMTIIGRIQGKDGQGFNTVHPNVCAWIDEAQYIDRTAIAEFYGMISGELPLIASGVPNGWRMSWAYQIDTDDSWGFVGGKMTRLEDPRAKLDPNWTANLERTYGGKDSNLFKQKVLGEWGAASTMTFNIDLITFDQAEAPPSWFRTVNIDFGNYRDRSDLIGLFAMGAWVPEDRIGDVVIHSDIGSTGSPSSAYISFWDKKNNAWRQYIRFLVYGMQISEQVEIFDYVATEVKRITKINPIIALDATDGLGKSISSLLQKKKWDVFMCDFNEQIKFEKRLENQEEINKRLAKDPWDDPEPQWVDQTQPMKQAAIPTLIREFYSGKLWVVNDDDIKGQLSSTSNRESGIRGQQKYETDYTKDDEGMYNHDLQSFEVLGALLHQRDFAVKPLEAPSVWVAPVDIPWNTEDPYAPYTSSSPY